MSAVVVLRAARAVRADIYDGRKVFTPGYATRAYIPDTSCRLTIREARIRETEKKGGKKRHRRRISVCAQLKSAPPLLRHNSL